MQLMCLDGRRSAARAGPAWWRARAVANRVIDIRSSGGLVRLQPRPTDPGAAAFRREYTPQPPAARRPGLDGNSRRDGALTLPMGPRALVLGVVVAAVGVCVPPAWGAFPGRDGELVVATGSGVELVAPGTGAAKPICTDVVLCGHPAQPRVSPNGRAIAFVDRASGRAVVVAPDGSCLWCLLGAPLTRLVGSDPGFTPGGEAVTVARGGLWRISLAGGGARRLVKGLVNGAVWSSRGLVALVREGWIWAGRPGHGKVRRLVRGRFPSFSPDGSMLAFARNGYVWIVPVARGTERRLVRGGAPAWSPSGRRIAYIAEGGAVGIIAVHGGQPHPVNSVHGTALDWQPLPHSARNPCTPPRGSTVLASDSEAVVFSQRGLLFYGCLRALGRARLLQDDSMCYCGPVTAVRLAGRFAALQSENGKPPTVAESDTLYDLGSGKATPLASVWLQTPTRDPVHTLDSVALDSSGFAAWRETAKPLPVGFAAISCPSPSLCIAGDDGGSILSSTTPTAGGSAWTIAGLPSAPPIISGASCPSVSLCAAVGANKVLTATDPSGGASAWTSSGVAGDSGLTAVSCPSVSLCVAVGGGPTILKILTSTDPTAGASSWSTASIPFDRGDLNAVSCPSVSLCVATTDSDAVFTSTNPTGGASAWTKTTIDQGGFLDGVMCPSVSLCVAVDSSGNALTSTNPTGGASTWTKANIDPGNPVWAVSCASVSQCVAVDLNGAVVTSTDPTGGAGAWTKARIDHAGFLIAVSCPSVALCVADDQNGNIVTSTDPLGGANAWNSAPVDLPGCDPRSAPCISEQLYARDDQSTRIVDSAPPGQGNTISNVALKGNSLILSWSHDNARRQAELR